MKVPYLSVVMPAYKEVSNFKAGVLKPTFAFLKKQSFTWEVIFVDDGSPDETLSVLQNFSKKTPHTRVITIPHGGRGAAYEKGMLEASGKYILYTDFDQSTPISELDKFWPFVKDGFDIVMGSRGGDTKTKRVDSAFNRFRAEVYVILGRLVFGFHYKDINCGFKLYKNAVAKKIFSSWVVNRPKKLKGAFMGAVDAEILYLASKFGYRVAEVPVDWYRRPTHGDPIKEPIMVLIDFLKIKLLDLVGRYDNR